MHLVRTYWEIPSESLEIWGQYHPDPQRPQADGEGGIGPQFQRTKTVLPNMSEQDAWHLHCY